MHPSQPDPLDLLLRAHVHRADHLIAGRMADAHAHALLGSHDTAENRLDRLLESLIGLDGSGFIGDSRARFYHDAHRRVAFNPEIHDPARQRPNPEGASRARTAPIGGIDAQREAAGLIDQAKTGLRIAVATTDDPAMRRAAVDTWHAQHRDRLRGWARGRLSDDQTALLAVVAELMLRPELRPRRIQ